MANQKIDTKLYVLNRRNVTRALSKTILGPMRGGLVHFTQLNSLKYALRLQERNDVDIRTDIPREVMVLIEGEGITQEDAPAEGEAPKFDTQFRNKRHSTSEDDEGEPVPTENDVDTSDPKTFENHSATTSDDGDEEPLPTEEDDENREPLGFDNEEEEDKAASEETDFEDVETDFEEEKPEWYLTYDEVQGKTKKDLLKHFSDVEEVKLSSSNNAEETKESVNKQLDELFPGHSPSNDE